MRRENGQGDQQYTFSTHSMFALLFTYTPIRTHTRTRTHTHTHTHAHAHTHIHTPRTHTLVKPQSSYIQRGRSGGHRFY